MFRKFDFNGNGYLSLAEVDKAVRDELQQPELFSSKPVLMRAFQAAKGVSGAAAGSMEAEYIIKREFRLCVRRSRSRDLWACTPRQYRHPTQPLGRVIPGGPKIET